MSDGDQDASSPAVPVDITSLGTIDCPSSSEKNVADDEKGEEREFVLTPATSKESSVALACTSGGKAADGEEGSGRDMTQMIMPSTQTTASLQSDVVTQEEEDNAYIALADSLEERLYAEIISPRNESARTTMDPDGSHHSDGGGAIDDTTSSTPKIQVECESSKQDEDDKGDDTMSSHDNNDQGRLSSSQSDIEQSRCSSFMRYSSQSDMDSSVSMATSYSADNEMPSLRGASIRTRGQLQHTIPEDAAREQWSPGSNLSPTEAASREFDDPPPDVRNFPTSPFSANHKWDNSFGIFPTSFDSSYHDSSNHDTNHSSLWRSYGSMSSSGHSDHDVKSPTAHRIKSDQIQCTVSDDSSAPLSPRSESSAESGSKQSYDFNDLSSSERTPILSNHGPRNLDFTPKSGVSIETINEEDDIGVKEELKIALLRSPTRKVLTTPSRSRPEPLHKLLIRQRSVASRVDGIRGKKQPTLCRDVLFAIVYMLQLVIVICLGLRFGPGAFGLYVDVNQDRTSTALYTIQQAPGIHFAYVDVLMIIWLSGIVAIVVSAMAFMFMAVFAKQWIPMALRMATTLSIVVTLFGLIQTPQNFVPVLGLVAIAITIAYAFMVWDEIPFVSANLNTALVACRSASGIINIAIAMQLFALVWIIIYFLTGIGLYNHFQEHEDALHLKWQIWTYIGLALSFNWTIQAMMNVTEVCIAGYINRWWLKPNLNLSQKNEAIGESLVRAFVYSFGSVCFGSMFIGIVNALRAITDQIRPNTEEAPIRCLVVVQEFIVSCVDTLSSIFNGYAMITIGMYGYDFLEAGKQANSLFEKRGWQDIVSNSLLHHLLLIISLIIASLIGCVSVEIERRWKLTFVSMANPSTCAFCIGFSVGLVLSNILFNVITSAVKSILVCFAGSPDELQQNHPDCSHIMREAWKESFPGLVDYVADTNNSNIGRICRSPNAHGLRFKRESLESLYV